MLFSAYLKPFDEATKRVYRSEIQQFFDFAKDAPLAKINSGLIQGYREKIGKGHTAATTKRKFSILNGFFKLLEKKEKRFTNPITSLKELRTRTGADSEELKAHIKAFLALQNTANTRRSYENLVQAFFSWVNKDPGELGKSDITGYRDYLREKGYKDSTVWNKFIALNRFLKYLEGENRKFHNPISFKELKLIFPKKDRGYYTVLAKPEAEKLLQQPSRKDDIGKRDLAILLLMLVYGLRANEITKLRFGNLEPERVKGQQKVWIVDRKGKYQNRPETPIILNGRTLKAFDEWLQVVKASGIKPKEETPIFLPFIYDQDAQELIIRRKQVHTPLTVKAVENVVDRHIRKAKIKRDGKTLSAHALRHTAFTLLARAGLPIEEIQKLAGHQDINTTMIYVHSAQSFEDHPGMHSPLNR